MSLPSRMRNCQLIDAHLHLQDPKLVQALGQGAAFPGIDRQLVNGTGPDDWQAVHDLKGDGQRTVLKAYGVHPWKVGPELSSDWESTLKSYLQPGAAGVGEIGLDNWIEPRDEELQETVFLRQLELAHSFNLTPTIHCLRAWGRLYDLLRTGPELARGFLVHGYGGSVDMLHQLADLGGHFSFSAYALDPKRKKMRDAIRACPMERILLETDAPDMVPSPEVTRFPLADNGGNPIHHPMELHTACEEIARMRNLSVEDLGVRVRDNFDRLFGLGPA